MWASEPFQEMFKFQSKKMFYPVEPTMIWVTWRISQQWKEWFFLYSLALWPSATCPTHSSYARRKPGYCYMPLELCWPWPELRAASLRWEEEKNMDPWGMTSQSDWRSGMLHYLEPKSCWCLKHRVAWWDHELALPLGSNIRINRSLSSFRWNP